MKSTSLQALNEDSSLEQWLSYIESQYHKNIEMGLERVALVSKALSLSFKNSKVITVAGTNGKGTTCACIEQLCLAHGKTTAVYSSPHLLRYTERMRVNNQELSEQEHVNAFCQVEKARGKIPLTYFEYGTLAGLWLAAESNAEVIILEVGLGGRLDAVNIIDPDIAVITTIDIDHIDYLGDNREDIGREKAGILRANIPFICGELNPTQSLLASCQELSCDALMINRDFSLQSADGCWSYCSLGLNLPTLELPFIPLQNAATAITAVNTLLGCLDIDSVNQAIKNTRLPGRFQQISVNPKIILDVAHNPQACRLLRQNLQRELGLERNTGKVIGVVAMLADKDINGSLVELANLFSDWYLATLAVPRGATFSLLQENLPDSSPAKHFDSVEAAYQNAVASSSQQDTIVVFGSFFTVASVLENL